MGEWKLSKEEFERCKKEAVEKTAEKFFPDIERKVKMDYVCFLRNYLMNLWWVRGRYI